MAESHVITGLVAKRAEMMGQIDHFRQELDCLAAGIAHLDATIKLFSPDFNLRTVRTKEYRRRNHFFQPGECQRMVLEIIRDLPGTFSSRMIAEQLVVRKGLESTPDMIKQMQKNAGATLRGLEKSETIRPMGRDGTGQTWELVSSLAVR